MHTFKKHHPILFVFLLALAACTSSQEKTAKEWALPANLAKAEYLFLHQEIGVYPCSLLEMLYLADGEDLGVQELVKVDSTLQQQLFGNYTDQRGDFIGTYLYAIEKPFSGLFPILIIRNFGPDESQLAMVLYNAEGKVLNTIVLASIFGEVGGCMSSEWKNDSTLIQTIEWHSMGGHPETKEEVMELNFTEKSIVFQKEGTYAETLIREWKEVE